jgi:hypothetical protein
LEFRHAGACTRARPVKANLYHLRMRVTLSTPGIFHIFALARELENRVGTWSASTPPTPGGASGVKGSRAPRSAPSPMCTRRCSPCPSASNGPAL